MKYADKIGAKFSMVLGDDEISRNTAVLKNMQTGEKTEISIGEDFISSFMEKFIDDEMKKTFGGKNE